MARMKYVPKVFAGWGGEAVPFDSAAQAWLWYGACQLARNDGARPVAGVCDVPRPCDPDDIYCAVWRLYRGHRLRRGHLSVLGRFAVLQRVPDPLSGDGRGQAILWDEAMDRLGGELRGRGILA